MTTNWNDGRGDGYVQPSRTQENLTTEGTVSTWSVWNRNRNKILDRSRKQESRKPEPDQP